mmetsp:Transcript_10099/g.15049  ORF Transcript_10099/g.15049 Transcript_10099/m.15049 type:complete len:96 (-) Transcript_10099:723-1010(-)
MSSSTTQQQREQRILSELNAILHTLTSISYVLDEIEERLTQTSSLTGQQEAIHQLSLLSIHTSGTCESKDERSSCSGSEKRVEKLIGSIANSKSK